MGEIRKFVSRTSLRATHELMTETKRLVGCPLFTQCKRGTKMTPLKMTCQVERITNYIIVTFALETSLISITYQSASSMLTNASDLHASPISNHFSGQYYLTKCVIYYAKTLNFNLTQLRAAARWIHCPALISPSASNLVCNFSSGGSNNLSTQFY